MKDTPTVFPVNRRGGKPFDAGFFHQTGRCFGMITACLLLAVVIPTPARAQQTISLGMSSSRVAPADVYSGVNYSGVHTNGFTFTTAGGTDEVDLQVTNLPPGVTVNIFPAAYVPTSANSVSVNAWMGIAVTNVAAGDYTLYLVASSTNPSIGPAVLTFGLHVGNRTFWTATDAANNAWSVSTNWSPNPPANLDVGFENQPVDIGTNVVLANTTIGRLTYLRSANNTFWRTVLNPGVTLLVTNGFSANSINADASGGTTHNFGMVFTGSSGASLIVSNQFKDFALNMVNSAAASTTYKYDFSGLPSLKAYVNRFGVGDLSLITEGTVGAQNFKVNLPVTTVVAYYVDPSGYTAESFKTAIQFFSHDDNTSYQNGQQFIGNTISSAAFWADSLNVGGGRLQSAANILSIPGITQMRNTDGTSRMTLLGVAVDSGTNTISSGDRFTLDLGGADILVDKLWLGRCRPRQGAAANAHVYGTLTYRGGTMDVNTAVLGYQIVSNDNDCRGILNITNGALVVNNLMVLGYSVGDLTGQGGPYSVNGNGQLNLAGASGRARINTVTIGGPGKVSVNNLISLSGGSDLTLTNTIGAPDAKLNQLALNASSLTLLLNGLDAKIYTKAVTNAGTCAINFAAITNTGTYPVQIPLISYETQSASFTLGNLPSASPGYAGYLTNDTSSSNFCLVLTSGPTQPGPVTWTGAVSGDWDTTTTNWLNFNTPYTFADGVPVRFDDSGLSGSVNLTAARTPSRITVSNNAVTYTFTGSGKLSGGGGLAKQGPGTLFVDNSSANDFSGGINLGGGTLQIGISDTAGGLGTGNVTNNAALVFNRSDSFVVANAISGNGTLTQNGGGTVSLSGVDTYSGDTTVNAGSLALSGSTGISGSANITVAAGAMLDVSGRTDGTLTLAGGQNLRGNGVIRGNLTAGPGSVVAPGQSVGVLTVTNAVVLQGTTIVEIDKTAGTHDLLSSQSSLTYGGTLVVSNLSAVLADGDSFKVFNASSYSGAFAGIVPPAPDVGLAWDTNSLITNGVLKVVSTVPPGLLTWTGTTSGDWDTTTTNWVNLSATPSVYADGLPVRFNDSGLTSNVNLNTALAPSLTIVDNTNITYTFTGGGKLSGSGGLIKLDSGALSIANSSANDFSGGISLGGGTLQIGIGGTNGSLGTGSVTNNAALVFDRSDSLVVSNAISGSGALTQNGGGTVTLAGADTCTGDTVVNAGSLALAGTAGVPGSVNLTVASGAVLDVSGRTDGTLTLAGGQTLRGSGTVWGNLIAGPGSTVSPGLPLGILTVTNAVALQGTTAVEIDKTAGTNDLLRSGGSLTYGGTLVVSNLSAALADGDSFKVFDALSSYSGGFSNIVPKRPGDGLAWDTSGLTDSGTLGVTLAPPVTPSPSLKIDFSIAGRAEAIDPTFLPWVINSADVISSNYSGVTITFTRVGPFGTSLTGDWWKSGVDDLHCLMADDGLTVANGNLGGQIEMRISGLSPGPHTIATYHNTWADPATHTFSPINISVNGVLTVTNLVPSNRVTNNYDAASAFMNVVAEEDQDVVILYQSNTNTGATDNNVWIDGLEIDTVASTLKALNPTPANGDEHVDVDSGGLTLGWEAALSAVSQDIYFGTDSNAVSTATHASPEFKGNQTATNYAVSGLNSLLTYYWRVDEVDATNGVAKGDLWYFRKRHLAFPGAEGYGRFARGGRGGVVLEVTNLADSGPGTLRWAVTQTLADDGPRTIVFAVSGLIELQSELTVGKANSKLTIAGQTAPGKGINIKKYPLGFSGGDDVIVRDMRSFPGKYSGDTVNGMGFGGVDNSIMDHCSSGWSMDECIPTRGAQNMTIQHVMISEPLNVAGHKNYPPGTRHGYSSSTSGNIGSWHHDLLANAEGRNWSLAGGLTGDGNFAGYLDIRNNVVYNWNGRTTDGGVAELDFVNNYYKKGPVGGINTYLNPDHGTNADGSYGQRYYSSGNTMPGYPQSNTGGWMTNQPFFPSYVTTQSATNAYKIVLSDVGCTQPMVDDHDTRQIREALYGTNTYWGSVSGLPGLPDSETDVGGWENYPEIHRATNWDSDHDGLPDWWEVMRGLNPHSPPGDFSDANADLVGDEYTELDRYLNFMAAPHYDCATNASVDVDLSQYAYGFSQTSPVYAVSNPTNGTIQLLGDGKTARFTATNSFNGLGGLGAFQFNVVDSQGDTMTNCIGIHILAPGAANTAPVLSPVSDKAINVGVNLIVTNTATDADVPVQTLTFSLTTSVTNAALDANNGVFTWRPLVTQANSTNPFTVVVTDNGTPNLSATQSFSVIVNPLTMPSFAISHAGNGQIAISVNGQLGPDYAVQGSSNLVNWNTLWITNPMAMPFGWTTNTGPLPVQFYRIKVGPPLP